MNVQLSSPGRTPGLLVVDRGELGWAACALAPRARHFARGGARVVVVAPRDRWPLYSDFACRLLPLEVEPGSSDFLWGTAKRPDAVELAAIAEREGLELWPEAPEARRIAVEERAAFADRGIALRLPKAWARLGAAPRTYRSVCVAFRQPKLVRGTVHQFKAWPRERCEALVEALQHLGWNVVAVGGPDNWRAGAEYDLRGSNLELQAVELARAAACVGPSSGTLHLAQLAGCPVVTWYGDPNASSRRSSEARYRGSWNPFGAPLEYLLEPQPTVEQVLAGLGRLAVRGEGMR